MIVYAVKYYGQVDILVNKVGAKHLASVIEFTDIKFDADFAIY
jgi:NAD(P)-dependent dehydrogenase (short-subunit alcohol dehydrogenase family)